VSPSPRSTAQGGVPPGCLRRWQPATIGDAERPLSGGQSVLVKDRFWPSLCDNGVFGASTTVVTMSSECDQAYALIACSRALVPRRFIARFML
jgi:hypothetical protein